MEIDKHPIQIQYQFIQETLIKIDSTAETKTIYDNWIKIKAQTDVIAISDLILI